MSRFLSSDNKIMQAVDYFGICEKVSTQICLFYFHHKLHSILWINFSLREWNY